MVILATLDDMSNSEEALFWTTKFMSIFESAKYNEREVILGTCHKLNLGRF